METERSVVTRVTFNSPLASCHGDEVDAAAAPVDHGRARLISDLKAQGPRLPGGRHTDFLVALPVLVQLRAPLKVTVPRMDAEMERPQIW